MAFEKAFYQATIMQADRLAKRRQADRLEEHQQTHRQANTQTGKHTIGIQYCKAGSRTEKRTDF
jgi:hypothetical protein